MRVNQLIEDGFFIANQGGQTSDLAMTSLRIAIKSYFASYSSIRYFFNEIENRSHQRRSDEYHSLDYYEHFCNAIVHFQHFVELAVKHFLRKEHELLATNASNDIIIFDKLLKGEDVAPEDIERLRSIEFSDAFDYLIKLVSSGRLNDPSLTFFQNSVDTLRRINTLRNRIWHRGAFVLRYSALDQLYGRYLLPIAKSIVAHPDYTDMSNQWKYQELNCGIDPLDEIINEVQSGQCNLKKLAWLKELGRAAYVNPIHPWGGLEERDIKRFERAAKAQDGAAGIDSIRKCPVCGCLSMIVYIDQEVEYEDLDTISAAWEFTWQASCICCTFEVTKDLGNPSDHGLTQIQNLWHSRDLLLSGLDNS